MLNVRALVELRVGPFLLKTAWRPTDLTLPARSFMLNMQGAQMISAVFTRSEKITKEATISHRKEYILRKRACGREFAAACIVGVIFCTCVHVSICDDNPCPSPPDSVLDKSLFVQLTKCNTLAQLHIVDD